MKPTTLDLPDMVAGDHWRALVGGITITVNDLPPANPLSSVRIRFAPTDVPINQAASETRVELSSDEASQIVITDAANWEFNCPVQPLALTAGNWRYNIETTDTTGVVSTFIEGVQIVLPDV